MLVPKQPKLYHQYKADLNQFQRIDGVRESTDEELIPEWNSMKGRARQYRMANEKTHLAIAQIAKEPRKTRTRSVQLPDEVWVMAYHTSTMIGSVAHVSEGDKFYSTKEECQRAIDQIPDWIGMVSREQYRPLRLIKGMKS